MPFISISFAVFFLIFVVLYHCAAHLKNAVLIQKICLFAASLVFYAAADFRFVPFLFYIIAVSYMGGRFCKNKIAFALFIAADVLPLLFFKYSRTSLIFPLGLSFFTFQSISYIADVFTKKIKAEQNPFTVALFISFFPTLSSGPIQRAGKLIPQFERVHTFDYDNATNGMKLFAWGLFKKLAIADRIAVYVNIPFSQVEQCSGCMFLFSVLLYSFQIYCDFSGYSDMSIGVARFIGVDAGKNFDHPYLSKSVGEFWRRWHISLSSWLRDYIYIPLGGSRVAPARIYLNLLITFLVSGIWHGSSAHFVVWGALNGIYLCIERMLKPVSEKIKVPAVLKILFTFLLITITWIFFRADTTHDALIILRKIVHIPQDIIQFFEMRSTVGLKSAVKILLSWNTRMEMIEIKRVLFDCLPVAAFAGIEFATYKKSGLEIIQARPLVVRWIAYIVLICLILPVLVTNENTEFLYFAF